MAPEPELTDGLTNDEMADLVRLADGTLPAERRVEVEARVAASPQLSRLAERQGVALEALRGTANTGAPARLRAEVERRRVSGRSSARSLKRVRITRALSAATAAGLALILAFSGIFSASLSVADAAALAQKPPTQPAPRGVPAKPQLLRAAVGGVPFPNYAAKFGWKPVGAREDAPSGRHATTVYYENGARRIAYTIVSGDALGHPSDARSTTRAGVEYRSFRYHGRAVVTWERGGHTCVLSGGKSVSPAQLVALADWRGKGAIPF
jgi:hypothetical protein